MQLIPCNFNEHSTAIQAIFNDAIANTTALYEYAPRNQQHIAHWFARKAEQGFPVIGAINEQQQFMGFASYGPFRGYPANKYSVEHSVYVHKAHRGKGVAKTLMRALIAQAQKQQLHVMLGAIDAANQASINLHQQLGFQHTGTLPQIAFKFGRWLDLAFYQRVFNTPQQPLDDAI